MSMARGMADAMVSGRAAAAESDAAFAADRASMAEARASGARIRAARAEQEAAEIELCLGMHEGHEDADKTPGKHDACNPFRCGELCCDE